MPKNNGVRKQKWALYRELGKELTGVQGHKGGRPRRVQHDPSAKRCRCVSCRKARGEAPYKVKKAAKAKGGGE